MANNNPTGINQYSRGSRLGRVGKNAYVWHGSNQQKLAGKTSLTPQRGDPVYATGKDAGIAHDYGKPSKSGARGAMVKVARSSFPKQNRIDVAAGVRNFHASKAPVRIVSKTTLLRKNKRK